jgi:hypothetical protein
LVGSALIESPAVLRDSFQIPEGSRVEENTMKLFMKPLYLTLAVVVLAATLTLLNNGPVVAQTSHSSATPAATLPSIPVSVTNTPLPVTGSVNANVTGAVGVTSLPAVQLSGTPAVSLNTTPATPLYVDADRPARNGFNTSCFTGNVDSINGQASCSLLTIPAGRQVVIETISCQAELYTGQGPGDVQLIVPNSPFSAGGPDHVSHLLTLTKQSSSSSLDIWRMTSPLRAYAGAPSGGSVDVGLFFRANPASPPPQDMTCTISGYLVGQ